MSEFFKDDQDYTSRKDESNLKSLKTHERLFFQFGQEPILISIILI